MTNLVSIKCTYRHCQVQANVQTQIHFIRASSALTTYDQNKSNSFECGRKSSLNLRMMCAFMNQANRKSRIVALLQHRVCTSINNAPIESFLPPALTAFHTPPPTPIPKLAFFNLLHFSALLLGFGLKSSLMETLIYWPAFTTAQGMV